MGRVSEALCLVAATAGGAYFVLWGCASPPMRVNFSGMPETNKPGQVRVQAAISQGTAEHPEAEEARTRAQVIDMRASLGLFPFADFEVCIHNGVGGSTFTGMSAGPRFQLVNEGGFRVMSGVAVGSGSGSTHTGEGSIATDYDGVLGELSAGYWLNDTVGIYQSNRLSYMDGDGNDFTRLRQHALGVELRHDVFFLTVEAQHAEGTSSEGPVRGTGGGVSLGMRFGGPKQSKRRPDPPPRVVPVDGPSPTPTPTPADPWQFPE